MAVCVLGLHSRKPSETTSLCFCRNVDALPVELDSVYIIRVSFDVELC